MFERTSAILQVSQMAVVKNLPANAGEVDSIPELGRYLEGNSYPLQYSCLGNPMDWGPWHATVHEVAESDMTEHELGDSLAVEVLYYTASYF